MWNSVECLYAPDGALEGVLDGTSLKEYKRKCENGRTRRKVKLVYIKGIHTTAAWMALYWVALWMQKNR